MEAVFANAPFGYALHKIIRDEHGIPVDYTFIEVNDVFTRIFGLDTSCLTGRSVTEAIPAIAQDPFDWIAFYGKLALEQTSDSFEQFSAPLGRYYCVQAYSPQKCYFVTIYTDITEQKVSSQQLENEKNSLQAMSNNMLDLVAVTDAQGTYAFAGPSHKVLGYSTDYLIGKNVLDFVHPLDLSAVESKFSALLNKTDETGTAKYRYRCADGSYLWFETIGTIISDDGCPARLLFNTRDITQQKKVEEKLEENNQLLESLSRQIPGVIYQYRVDPNGHACFPFASAHITDVYEVEPDDVKQDAAPVMERLHPDDHDRVAQSIAESKETLETWEDAYRVILPQKGERWLRGIAQPEQLQDGSVIWYGYIWDVTDSKTVYIDQDRFIDTGMSFSEASGYSNDHYLKKELYQLIKTNDSIFDFIQAGSLDGLWYWDLENTENEWMNNKFWTELGYSPDRMAHSPTSWQSIIYPDDLNRLIDNFHKHCENPDYPYDQVVRYTHKNGSTVWIHCRGLAIRDNAGKPIRMIGAHQNITEQKMVEEALRKNNSLHFKMLSNIGDVIVIIDENGNNRYKSNNLEHLFGWTPDELIGSSALNTVHPEDQSAAQSFIYGLLAKPNRVEQFECRYQCKDGTCKWINFTGINLIDDPDIRGILGNYHDITERKNAEDAMKLAKEQAESANSAKSVFLANMSHEIRTPMNSVIGFSELLQNTELNSPQKQFVDTIVLSAKSLLGIINDILDFSKIEAGKLELEIIQTDIIDLLEQTSYLIQIQAEKKGITLLLHIDPAIPRYIMVDPGRLRQVLANLLSNALKFTNYGEIELKALLVQQAANQARIQFSVRDTGIGMSKQQRKKLFRPFSQGDSSMTRRYGGTGLGLVISDQLVQKMGGALEIDSVVDKGSEFSFTLSSMIPTDIGIPPDIPQNGSTRILRGIQVLIAEDDRINMRLLTTVLQTIMPHATVIKTVNGAEAVEQYSRHLPELILMDLQMPVLDGIEASRQIRAIEGSHTSKPIIIALTADVSRATHEACKNSGIDCILTKPLDLELLRTTLLQMF